MKLRIQIISTIVTTGFVLGAAWLVPAVSTGARTDVPAVATTKPALVKILPIGDSITQGVGSAAATSYSGYRGPLQASLKEDGVRFDFVGPQRTGRTSVDVDHAGYSGYRIDQVATLAPAWVRDYDPDVVLLHLGTNDANQNYRVDQAPQRIATLIASIRSASPGVKIIMATLVPSTDAKVQERVEKINAGILTVFATEAAAHDDIYLVDMSTALTPKVRVDFADRLHPNDAGYIKMAAVWDLKLNSVLADIKSDQCIVN